MSKSLLHPRHWASWLAVLILRIIALLPFKVKMLAGGAFGRFGYRFFKRRRHITATNIALCFPQKSTAEQTQLVKDIFVSNGIGFFEIAWAWWANPESLRKRFTVHGLDVLKKATENGQGVLLIGGHYTHLDLAGLMVNLVADMDVIYRKNNDAVFEHVITEGRKRVFKNVLERSDMRDIIRKLRDGRVVWFSPDQDHGIKNSVFAPFFDIPAATVTSASKLMKLGKANPVFVAHKRDLDTNHYHITFAVPEDEFPSGDDVTDASIINQMIEHAIRQQPDQYMWVHRRFKTRPPGEPSVY
ncbi:LpxL/LpxP family Kdo(2)-lipid IV(A) lauroyl/palmitoleoyl acyltransferase [Paraglaciecola chathamensis]|nr:LpxL/LpxP family Kdo(2)-lipid IV(A) lauroyl/palmitoleoyl acyltransferase [Paraglaciecola agarilytica]